jgi:type II secretory pathway component PulL
MISVLQTKLLIVIVALLAGIASYFAYQRHEQQVEQMKVNSLYRHLRPDEKRAIDATSRWGNEVNKRQLK